MSAGRLLAVCSGLYAWFAVWWSKALTGSAAGVAGHRPGIANWGLLLLVAHLVMAAFVVLIVAINLSR